jgi:hypothetical protein
VCCLCSSLVAHVVVDDLSIDRSVLGGEESVSRGRFASGHDCLVVGLLFH